MAMDIDHEKFAVLIVDDDPFILATTRVVLERLGYRSILTAERADQALNQLRAAIPPVGLVLSDLNMPDIDGVELLRLFGEQGYDGDIVLFSGEDDRTLSMTVTLARARNLSVLGAIGKPLRMEALAALLAQRKPRAKPGQRRATQEVTPAMLAAAIEAEELVPWYQPKIDVASKAVVGFEALARWPRAAGMIFPDAFIPVAEENGLIDALTFLLIRQSVRMDRQWREQGISAKVAVNISMDSLHDLAFPDLLDQAFKGAGGDSAPFQLEVTESRLMDDYVNVLDVLLRLRLKKVRLSIDDFGTGHSNLSQLRDLPFDELKLDQSYVQQSASEPRARTIIESSIAMAKNLGMDTVAEGVETLDDWRRMEAMGCSQIQGYFVSRPMPGERVPAWIAEWETRHPLLFG